MERKGFKSNFGFIMAAVGSAVGLGNIWGFPNKMGANGGFTFLLIYLLLAVFCGFIIMLGELADALAEKSLHLKYTDAAAALIAEKSFSAKFGARNMRRYIQRNVEDPIAEAVIADYTHSLSQILVHVKDGELKVTCM